MYSANRIHRTLRVTVAALAFAGVLAPLHPAAAAGGDHTVTGTGCTTWHGSQRVPIPLIYVYGVPYLNDACLKIEASTIGGGDGRAQLLGVETPNTEDVWLPSIPTVDSEDAIELLDLELDCVAVEESPTSHTIFASGTDADGERAWVTVTTNGFRVSGWEDPFTPCGAREFTMDASLGGYTIDHIDPSPNSFPTAAFEATCEGLTCTFDASTSSDTDGEVVRYRWWVDRSWHYDAPQSKHGGQTFSLTLPRANLLTVKLRVTDDDGGINDVQHRVHVGLPESKQAAPSCNGLTCTFDASPSTDSDGTVVEYYWDLPGDGGLRTTDPKLTYTYSQPGTFTMSVLAFDNDGNRSPDFASVEVEVSADPSVPVAPASLSAGAESTSTIRLDWTDVTGESGYKIEHSSDGKTWTQVVTASADSTTYTDSGLSPSTTYSYRVIATNDTGDSAPSPIATATTLADTTAPTAPTNLVAKSARARIGLTWDAASDEGGSGVAGYSVYRSIEGFDGAFSLIASDVTATSYDDRSVKKGKTYWYYVVAIDRAGNNSAPSNVATTRAN